MNQLEELVDLRVGQLVTCLLVKCQYRFLYLEVEKYYNKSVV